ncbi:hypothetical protein [Streptomyces sp. WMMB 322]|uniref:hypothetical protein n=1 Tax=Streptomyces sp. WMMB 322 TaxID=1286821 RepID=UPI0006E23819|nr:hypothetical protein [Streptomyces sp. WMMB 322]SCK09610.1 hypothetical protein H180DRAFT_00481 [Streptomyces sp. WMMB 322]
MSRNGRGRRIAGRLAASAVLTACTMLWAPQAASACDVGYGYKPSITIDDLNDDRTCSTSTSAAGAVTVAILALGALATAGLLVFRKGERQTGSSASDQRSQSPALTTYLSATGIITPTSGQDHAS